MYNYMYVVFCCFQWFCSVATTNCSQGWRWSAGFRWICTWKWHSCDDDARNARGLVGRKGWGCLMLFFGGNGGGYLSDFQCSVQLLRSGTYMLCSKFCSTWLGKPPGGTGRGRWRRSGRGGRELVSQVSAYSSHSRCRRIWRERVATGFFPEHKHVQTISIRLSKFEPVELMEFR